MNTENIDTAHDIEFRLINRLKQNGEDEVYAKNGKHYIFYVEENIDNQFGIFSDLTTSDAVFFKQPIGSKLKAVYTISFPFADMVESSNQSNQLNLVLANYSICNKKGEQSQTFQSGTISDSALRRAQYIAGESVKYTLAALGYILPGTVIKLWLI